MISGKINFPDLETAFRRKKLTIPTGRVRAVLDTDTFNEVDDQMAVSMAMLAKERFEMEAVMAAPFFNSNSTGPADGMEKSYEELQRLMKLLHHPEADFIYRGAVSYLPDRNTPADSPAARRIVDLAHSAAAQGENLWVMSIAAITNVASALLLDPEIVRMITVVWLGGHPLYWSHNREFNLFQDVPAAQVIFDSGVPLIQIPCCSVAELLQTGPDELRARCAPTGKLGSFLTQRVCDAVAAEHGYSRSIWDISAPGIFLVPYAFDCEIVPAPRLEDSSAWVPDASRHEMAVVRHIFRNPVFDCLFKLLAGAPK